MIQKLISNSIIYGLAPNIPKLASLFILPLLTAHLTDVDYGISGTIMTYTMALSAFSTLGFNVVLQNVYFKQHDKFRSIWRDIYGFLQLWMVVFAIIQSLILYFVIPDEASNHRWLIIILTNLNGVIFGPAGFIGPLFFQLQQKPMPIAIRSVVGGLLALVINYITIVTFKMGYLGWYISSFLGTFIINISYWGALIQQDIRPSYNFNVKLIKDKLKVALPTIPHYYSVFLIQTSSRLVMDWFHLGLAPIGIYNLSQQITTYVETGVLAIDRATTPMCMHGLQNDKEADNKRYTYVYLLITFLACFLFSLWSKEIFQLLISNKELAQAYPYAAVLIMALCYRPMYFTASNIYLFYEKTKKILSITFFAGIGAFVANIIFIPKYGLWAAVVINYCAYLFQGYSAFFIYKYFEKKSKVSYPYKSIFAIQILLTIIAITFLETIILVKVLISCLILISFMIFSFYEFKVKKPNL